MRKDRTVELECVACTHATDKALLVHVPQVEEPTWVPISQVSEDSEVQRKGAFWELPPGSRPGRKSGRKNFRPKVWWEVWTEVWREVWPEF